MRGEVLDGVERRRRWSDEQKLRLLMEVGLRGATLTDGGATAFGVALAALRLASGIEAARGVATARGGGRAPGVRACRAALAAPHRRLDYRRRKPSPHRSRPTMGVPPEPPTRQPSRSCWRTGGVCAFRRASGTRRWRV